MPRLPWAIGLDPLRRRRRRGLARNGVATAGTARRTGSRKNRMTWKLHGSVRRRQRCAVPGPDARCPRINIASQTGTGCRAPQGAEGTLSRSEVESDVGGPARDGRWPRRGHWPREVPPWALSTRRLPWWRPAANMRIDTCPIGSSRASHGRSCRCRCPRRWEPSITDRPSPCLDVHHKVYHPPRRYRPGHSRRRDARSSSEFQRTPSRSRWPPGPGSIGHVGGARIARDADLTAMAGTWPRAGDQPALRGHGGHYPSGSSSIGHHVVRRCRFRCPQVLQVRCSMEE